jgi:predicted protein tyrosine phosphatase
MSFMNRMGNAKNQYQTDRKRVLCVCSAGLLRSPTMAWVLSHEPYNYNTRAAGLTKEYALIPVDDVLLHWADEILVAEEWMLEKLGVEGKPIYSLNLPDRYEYRDPELVKLIKESYEQVRLSI